MQGIRSYFVDGQSVYVPDDELDEFMAACRERGSQFEEADVFSATNADGETREFTVPRSQSEGFLSDAAANGGRADRMRTVAMGDGTRLTLGEGAVRQFVQARKNGAAMSRGLLKMAGIPEAYARGREEREAVADELARLFPDEDEVDGRGAALDNFGDALYRVGKGFVEGLTPEGIDDFYGEGSTVGNMIHGANDFANAATRGVATMASYALGGRDTAAGRAVRGWADGLRTDTADLETGAGDTANAVMDFAKNFIQETLTTIGKYAVPGAAAVDIMGGVVDAYCDAYNRAIANGATPDKANALASGSAGINAAEGILLAKAVGGGANANTIKGMLKRAAGMGWKMGAAGAARDVVEQGIEGAEGPDLVRAGKAGLKSGAEGAAFELMATGARALADAGRKGAEAASERRVRERVEKERRGAAARERYEGRLSEEANADIEATARQMVETGVLPTDATVPEVVRRAREKLGGRERGESHEAVELAVMESAQEVGERLATTARVTSPALERRQVEARMRDNERWARRSDELAAEYGREEAARRVAEERAAEERRAQGEAVQGAADAAAHEARQGDLEAAFRDYGERLDEAQAVRKRGGRAAEPETPQAIADAMRGDAELQALDAQYRTAKTAEAREEAKAKFAARVAELRQGMAQGAAEGAAGGAAQEPPQTREKAPASVPQETAATAPTEAAKPATAAQGGDTSKRLSKMSLAAQMRHYDVSRLAGVDFNEANLSAKDLEQFKSLCRDYAKGGTATEHDAAANALRDFVNAHGEAVVPTGGNTAPAAPTLSDRQGNPIDKSGKLKVETVKTMAEMTDEDFTAPTRSVQLPQIPPNVDAAIGAGGKPVIIKRNIFQKNASNHPELDAKTSREVLDRALYSPNLVGQSQPVTKPDYRVAVQTGDKNAVTILDVHQDKKHVEIVGWRNIDGKGFERLKRQAAREGGQFLILHPSEEGQPGALSGRPSGSTAQSIPQAGAERQAAGAAGAKPEAAAAKTTEQTPAEKKPAARRGATPEQLADLQAKIAEAEKVNKTAKADGAKEHAKFSVTVGTTSLTFNATTESIAAAKKLMGKLGRPTNWDRKPTPERVPSAPKPTKVEKAPADAADVLKDFVAANGQHPDKGLERPMTRNGHDYATDATFAVRTVAKPGAADSGDAKAAAVLENLFEGAAKAGTEAKTTTAELETALAQAMSVKGGRTRFDKKGSPDYDNDLVEVWRTKEGGIAVRARSNAKAGGELNNVTSAESASDAAFFSGGTLDGASLLGFASGNRLAKICKAFARRGDGEISVELDGKGGMFRFRGKNLEAVLMAKRGGDGEDLAGYEAASKRKGALYSLGDPRDGEMAQGGEKLFSISELYTGSAADYERPSLHAVGTGEGSQVYGWGLYASSVRGVAEGYAHKGNVETKINGKSVDLDSISARETPSGVIADTARSLSSKGYNASRDALIRTIRVELNSLDQRAKGKSQRDGAHLAELANRYRDALRILEDKSNTIEVLQKGNLYEQTFFTDRAPGDESHLLNWYEPIGARERRLASVLLTERGATKRTTIADGWAAYVDGRQVLGERQLDFMSQANFYDFIADVLGSPKAASEWLAAHGIDGVKYPVDSYGKTVKDGDKAGWNYVSFRDGNITVDHKWRDGERLFSISPKEASDWSASVDSFAAGKMPARSDATVLPRVPAVVSRVLKDFMGFDADGRSIVVSKECLDKVTSGKHNISTEDLKRLPLTLDAPLAVFQSKTRPTDSVTALVPIRDANGGISSVAAINYRATGGDGADVLRVTSVYGKVSSAAVQEWIDGGLTLYADRKNIARSFPHRLQLPGRTKTAHRFLDESDFSKEAIGIISKTEAGTQGGFRAESGAEQSAAADGGRVDMRRLDPARRTDAKVVAWAKKHGRTVSDGRVTPDAVREYDAQMAQGAAKAVRRWFPDMSVTYHDYGENVTRGRHAIDLRDTAGRALGWFEPGSKDVHLLPGADAATVAHEIMWHGSRDWATARAAAGDAKARKLVAAMRDVERNAPEDLKRRVNRLYRETGADADTLLNEYGAWLTMGKGGEALEAAMAKAENRAWYAKSLNVVKETVKDYLAAHGKNRVDLSKVDGMGRDEFVDFLSREFAGGKTLGEIGAKGRVKDVPTKETAFQKARRKIYDVNATLRDLQRDIEKKTGRKISEAEDAEAANALTPGLREAAVLNVRGKLDGYRDLLKRTGISDADAQYYMALKAAAGRDAKVDARNLAKLDAQAEASVLAEWGTERAARDEAGFRAAVETRKAELRSDYESSNGSHVSPVEARRMLAELESGEHAEGYGKIREYLRGVMDETLDAQVKSGLISEETAAKYRAEEPDYIPFKNEFDAASGDFVGRGAVNLGRPEHFTAKGRKSSAGDITAHIFGDYQATLLRGIEADVRQKLAKLVMANPELGTVEKVGEATRLKEKQKSDRLDPANATGDPNLVLFKQGGDTYAIRLNGERGAAIAAALTERNVKRMDGWFPKFARASAALATRWSPTFSVRNFTKDNIELANIVFAEKGAVEGAKWAGRYVKSQAQMAGTLAKFVTTGKVDATTREGRLLQKYIDAGGLIGGGATEGYDAMKKSFSPEAIAKEVKRGQSKSRAVANHALHAIAYLNEFAEMTTRVNAFVAELGGGATERQAALFSRRATVDFNRKGENTGVTNVVRLFSNSTLGATARATSALAKSRAGKVAAAALFANGFAQALLERAMNGEEDERRRKSGEATGRDVPEFERKTALFYVRSGDSVYKVAQHESPFSLLNYAGNCAGRVALGQMSLKDMAKNLGVSVAELAYHFTGLGSVNLTSRSGDIGDDAKAAIVSGLCPSALQPLAEVLVGTDYKGDRLYRQNFSATTPDSATAKKHTPEYAKTAAAWMNEATGGSEARKGYVDVHPEAVQKLVEGFGKNAARDVMNAYEVGKAILDGDLKRLTPRDVPVKRDFVRPLDGNTSRFFDAYDAYRADEAEFKGMSAKWTAAERREYLAAHPWLKYGKTGKRVVSVLIDGTNKDRPRTGVESMGINQLRKLTEGLVRTKSGGYAEPKRPVTDAEKERAKKVMMRKQALVIEKMGR